MTTPTNFQNVSKTSPEGGGLHAAIKVGIVGGAGYTGGELIRLLINHPEIEIVFIHSRSNTGKLVSSLHNDLLGEMHLKFSDQLNQDVDILFLCAGHGEAKKFLEENNIAAKINIIDLSQDFRLIEKSTIKNRKFIYGLPELNRKEIVSAKNIANPGCFATAIQLGLLPLAQEGLLKEVYTTGITGSTGAGQNPTGTSHFSWRANNIQAYKTLTHQHLYEIHQSLHKLQESFPLYFGQGPAVKFVPWRGDFTRGIFISSQVNCGLDAAEVRILYHDFYKDDPFTFLSEESISLKQVVNTNKCVIQVEKVGENLVVHSAIDNLLKGASGQAVQNMNLMFGMDETTGLKLKATGF